MFVCWLNQDRGNSETVGGTVHMTEQMGVVTPLEVFPDSHLPIHHIDPSDSAYPSSVVASKSRVFIIIHHTSFITVVIVTVMSITIVTLAVGIVIIIIITIILLYATHCVCAPLCVLLLERTGS